jgi:hypothetical protein
VTSIGIGFGYPAFGISAGYVGNASSGQGYASTAEPLEIPSADVLREFSTGLDASYGAMFGVTVSGSSTSGGRSAVTITGPAFGASYSWELGPLNDLIGNCREH